MDSGAVVEAPCIRGFLRDLCASAVSPCSEPISHWAGSGSSRLGGRAGHARYGVLCLKARRLSGFVGRLSRGLWVRAWWACGCGVEMWW